MLRELIGILCMTLTPLLCGCRSENRDLSPEYIHDNALERINKGKTYMLLSGMDDAISYFKTEHDTTALLEMYQLAAIRMRWKGEQDSAAMYLLDAVDYAGPQTSPSACDIYLNLAETYSHPLLKKDYVKAIEYARMADKADATGENRYRILHDIGIYYAFINQNDSAEAYVNKALDLTPAKSPYYATFALNYAGIPGVDLHKSLAHLDNIGSESLGSLITKGFLYLNCGQTDSAYSYLEKSRDLYESNPERYSINTYNSLRMLYNCVSYSRTGKVYPGEGTEINDSISWRIALNNKIQAETTEHNAMLEVELLESESRIQKACIAALAILLIAGIAFGWVFWSNKRKYINLHKEFDRLRQLQISAEADENYSENSGSFEIIAKRAGICIDRFRRSRLNHLIQKAEEGYNDSGAYLPVKDRSELRQSLLECFADFVMDLKMDAGKLTMDDIVTCLLSVMHASNSAIAGCLGVSAGAVRTRKTRLRSKLSSEMDALVFD